MVKSLFTIIILSVALVVSAQVDNDECIYAEFLGATTDYCSGSLAFSNVGATESPQADPDCIYGEATHDIWFAFVPTAPSVYVSMEGSLNNPSLALYEGPCSNPTLIGCNSSATGNFTEVAVNNVLIGQTYYIRADARNNQTGSFELCIKSFAPVKSPQSDCPKAVVLCDKSPFQVENLQQTGDIQNELTGSCVGSGQEGEQGSVWYVWTCDEPGTLEFTLTPNNPNNNEEDLDFVVYELPGGLTDCDNRVSLRCMLSGETSGLNSSPCYGPTGLRAGEGDTDETAGCDNGSNNFVAPLDMESGKHYALIVNNFSSSGFGFAIEFGGTGTFKGPEADFEIDAVQAFECDKSINFVNMSSSEADPIISINWNFGGGSSPSTAIGPGPHGTVYSSFGDKVAAVTVETARGCVVTKIKDFYIDPCCDDLPDLNVEGNATPVRCFDKDDGTILADASLGVPQYQYSIDGENYKPNPLFTKLTSGTYTITAVDAKGCTGMQSFVVGSPDSIKVFAGRDTVVDLGYAIQLDASYTPPRSGDSIIWSPTDGIQPPCDNCLDPNIIPPGETTYTLTIIDEFGCQNSDDITLRVNVNRPLFSPNVFSPNGDNQNDYFNLFGGPAIKEIQYLKIFDRWGNLVYDGVPERNNLEAGWDGKFNNEPVENGVYVWQAKVVYIDNVEIDYSGDVTVLR